MGHGDLLPGRVADAHIGQTAQDAAAVPHVHLLQRLLAEVPAQGFPHMDLPVLETEGIGLPHQQIPPVEHHRRAGGENVPALLRHPVGVPPVGAGEGLLQRLVLPGGGLEGPRPAGQVQLQGEPPPGVPQEGALTPPQKAVPLQLQRRLEEPGHEHDVGQLDLDPLRPLGQRQPQGLRLPEIPARPQLVAQLTVDAVGGGDLPGPQHQPAAPALRGPDGRKLPGGDVLVPQGLRGLEGVFSQQGAVEGGNVQLQRKVQLRQVKADGVLPLGDGEGQLDLLACPGEADPRLVHSGPVEGPVQPAGTVGQDGVAVLIPDQSGPDIHQPDAVDCAVFGGTRNGQRSILLLKFF